jgi:putative glutamine amidotransferase
MQLLAVVSGADMIQDITLYMSSLGKEYGYEHRYNPETPKAYRNFAAHDVKVTAEDSLLFRLIGTDTIKAVPSWHHQAVRSVDGTRLIITGETDTAGERIIEAIERPDKTFVLGLQYHPEIAVVRETDEASLIYFTTLVNMAKKNEK